MAGVKLASFEDTPIRDRSKATKAPVTPTIERIKRELMTTLDTQLQEVAGQINSTLKSMIDSLPTEPEPRAKVSASSPATGESTDLRGKKPAMLTAKNLGIPMWIPESVDIATHIDRIRRMKQEAKQYGATDHRLCRILMQSLPVTYEYVERFIEDDLKGNFDQFASEVERVLGDKTRSQMSKLISAQRKPGEDVLEYFTRLCLLYESANNLSNTQWQHQPQHTSAIYTKLVNSLHEDAKAEFIRRTDTKFESNELTLHGMKKDLLEIKNCRVPKSG